MLYTTQVEKIKIEKDYIDMNYIIDFKKYVIGELIKNNLTETNFIITVILNDKWNVLFDGKTGIFISYVSK